MQLRLLGNNRERLQCFRGEQLELVRSEVVRRLECETETVALREQRFQTEIEILLGLLAPLRRLQSSGFHGERYVSLKKHKTNKQTTREKRERERFTCRSAV